MHSRRVAASAALIISAGSLVVLPAAAQAAASGNTLYVDNSTECSDSTTNSSVTPYCTIQAAASVVEPGQTVKIAPGGYTGQVTLTRSGTATEPIVFEGTGNSRSNAVAGDTTLGDPLTTTTGYGLELSGVSNVEVSNIWVLGGTSGAVYITGSSAVRLDTSTIEDGGPEDVEVAGGSTNVTVEDSRFFNGAYGVEVDAGVSGTTVTNDAFESPGTAVAVNGASDTAVSGNTVDGPVTAGISVSGGATATTIENDIVTATTAAGIGVDAASAPGTTADYNIVYAPNSTTPYAWAGAAYPTAAALTAASGQGSHDLNTNPKITLAAAALPEGSPAINSGDAFAPGEPATDYNGDPRALDPRDAVTGTGGGYYDRGAVQIVDPLAVKLTASVPWAAGSLTQTLTTTFTGSPWSSDVTYTYDFGDGSTEATTAAKVTHTYTTAGSYAPTVTAVDADHGTAASSLGDADFQLTGGNAYRPLTPTRVLDTRHGIGTTTARVPADGSVTFKVAGVAGVPATGAVAAVLNVTAVGPTANGVITAYPGGTTAPTASNLNFLKGENRPNLVTVELGANGTVSLRNSGSGTVDLVADVEGYYAPGTGAGWSAMETYRAAEVTLTVGRPIEIGVESPSYDSSDYAGDAAVAVNITATGGTANGYLSAYASGGTVPTSSDVNYSARENIANLAIVPTGSDGGIELVAGGKAGSTVKAIVDVEGVYSAYDGGAGFIPVKPTRLIDTRSGLGAAKAGPVGELEVNPIALKGMPANSAGMAANLTVVDPSANGLLIASADGTISNTSTLNYAEGQNVANMALFGWAPGMSGQDLRLALETSAPYDVTAGLVLDMFGYFVY